MITTRAFHGTGQNLTLDKNNVDTSTDLIIYLSGKFSSITLFNLGNATRSIQIMPVDGETVLAETLNCNQCNNLKISGLGRMEVSGTTLDVNTHPDRPIVSISGNNCSIEGVRVCSTTDAENWSPADWRKLARNGIRLHGFACMARCNEVFNVRTGIEVRAKHGRATGNSISHFFEDGMRALADDVTLANNHISFACDSGSDAIHSDGIQLWNHFAANPQEGILSRVSIMYNTIRNHSEKPGSRLLQGIGCFDGMMREAEVIGNVVMTDHYHGITLGIAQNSRIEGNSVISTNADRKSWIKIGTNKTTDFVSSGNVLAFNESSEYIFKSDMVEQNIANNTLDNIGIDAIDAEQETAIA